MYTRIYSIFLSMSKTTLFWVYIVGYSLVAVFHTLGLYLLTTVTTELLNQKVLVTNLATSELVISIFMSVGYLLDVSGAWNKTWDYLDVLLICLS